MKSYDIRKQFLDFFESKAHEVVESAPMVIKDDPTLMFTNAGMNPFKEFFFRIYSANFKTYSRYTKVLKSIRET